MATLKDVAKLAGVHPSVVSRVVNNDRSLHIKEQTRDRIREALESLKYQPNATARNLKKSETRMLGMVIPDFSNPVYASIIHGAEDQAAQEGYSLLVYSMKQKGIEKNYFSHLLEGRIDGLLIANSESDDTEILHLQQANKPFVLVNRLVNGIENFVVLNDELAGTLATKHLAELGHRKIAHISGPLYTGTGLKRFQGYREGLKEQDIAFISNYVQESKYSLEDGYISTNKVLELPNPPTAIFAANVMICLGAMRAIYEKGLSIPHDMSIVGVHDVFFSSGLFPPLTTIKMPLYEMGAESVKKLTALINEGEHYRPQGLTIDKASLVIRKSTSSLR